MRLLGFQQRVSLRILIFAAIADGIGNQPRHREKTYIKSIADSARSDTEKGG
jgi:hypothetical protein